MHDSKEQNYWPGFVDALSNVVLTLIFVLVVFVFALVITSSKIQQKASEFLEQREVQDAQSKQQLTSMRDQLNIAENQLAAAKNELAAVESQLALSKTELTAARQKAQTDQKALDDLKKKAEDKERAETPSVLAQDFVMNVDGKPMDQKDTSPDIASTVGAIVVTFPRGVVILNDKAKADLTRIIEKNRGLLANTKVSMRSVMGAETYSEGRRMAYFRGLDVRNVLIDLKVAGRGGITMATVPSKEVGDGRVEIRFTR